MIDFVELFGAYGGAFAVSVVGSLMFVPFPYEAVLLVLSSAYNPALIALLGASGSTVGKTVTYLIGAGGRRLVSGDRLRKIERARSLLGRYGPPIIFIVAATPILDDPLYLALGMMRYSLPLFVLALFLGKLLLMSVVAASGYYALPIAEQIMAQAFGTLWGKALTIALVVVAAVVVVRVDWEKLALKLGR